MAISAGCQESVRAVKSQRSDSVEVRAGEIDGHWERAAIASPQKRLPLAGACRKKKLLGSGVAFRPSKDEAKRDGLVRCIFGLISEVNRIEKGYRSIGCIGSNMDEGRRLLDE